MKLNNKGFAISTIMYLILILGVIIITSALLILSDRKIILDKQKNEALDDIYGIKCKSNSEIITGVEIQCGTEMFYVINSDEESVTMLSKYNLSLTDTVKQDRDTTDVTNFSETNYWLDENNEIKSEYANNYVYDENSKIYEYLEGTSGYKNYLKNSVNLNVEGIRLMNSEETNVLITSGFDIGKNYWFGYIGGIDITSIQRPNGTASAINMNLGVRPVITILKSYIN